MIVIVREVSIVIAGLLANIGIRGTGVPTGVQRSVATRGPHRALHGDVTVVTEVRPTIQPKNVGIRNILNILAAVEAVQYPQAPAAGTGSRAR